MENRIEINKDEEQLKININALCVAKKQQLLLLWVVLFSLCGIAIVAQFFNDYDAETKVFFGVYIAFWLFFEFKVIYAYRWRKYGQEKVEIDGNELVLIKTIGRRGVTQHFKLEEIQEIAHLKDSRGDFSKSINTSYWNINNYQLVLKLAENAIPFGIDLNPEEAKIVLNELKKYCAKR